MEDGLCIHFTDKDTGCILRKICIVDEIMSRQVRDEPVIIALSVQASYNSILRGNWHIDTVCISVRLSAALTPYCCMYEKEASSTK